MLLTHTRTPHTGLPVFKQNLKRQILTKEKRTNKGRIFKEIFQN
jgi:hypothetical protein